MGERDFLVRNLLIFLIPKLHQNAAVAELQSVNHSVSNAMSQASDVGSGRESFRCLPAGGRELMVLLAATRPLDFGPF
jgi:hypothetical protein